MTTMDAKRLRISVQICHNAETVKLASLDGYAYVDAGFLVGELTAKELRSAENVLITAFCFTGCPLAAREDRAGVNPWRKTRGAYEARRVLKAKDFIAESEITARPNGNAIEMDLFIRIAGLLPDDFRGIARPFQEHIEQQSMGQLTGRFELEFLRENGDPMPAVADTLYRLELFEDVCPAWRNITILSHPTAAGLQQVEQIDLFAEPERANADLLRKRLVSIENLSAESLQLV